MKQKRGWSETGEVIAGRVAATMFLTRERSSGGVGLCSFALHLSGLMSYVARYIGFLIVFSLSRLTESYSMSRLPETAYTTLKNGDKICKIITGAYGTD
jgi:hypothetical protein